FELTVDILAKCLVLGGIRSVIMVKSNMEAIEIGLMLLPYAVYQLLGGNAFLFGAQHDRRAVSVVGTHIMYLVALHFLETNPNVCLNVFHEMPEVDTAVRVG